MLCFPTNAIFVGQNTKHLPYRKDAIEVFSLFFIFSIADYNSFICSISNVQLVPHDHVLTKR